jgi:hypothetical protein
MEELLSLNDDVCHRRCVPIHVPQHTEAESNEFQVKSRVAAIESCFGRLLVGGQYGCVQVYHQQLKGC